MCKKDVYFEGFKALHLFVRTRAYLYIYFLEAKKVDCRGANLFYISWTVVSL